MKSFLIALTLLTALSAAGQELYVFSEPASNMPAHSLSVRVNTQLTGNRQDGNGWGRRYRPELMWGANKKWMIHAATTFSNMYSNSLQFESVSAYAKYRFLSNDDVHTHFRMAFFTEAAYSTNPYRFNELSLAGDKTGVEAGLIATQLWNRFALSSSVAHTQVFGQGRGSKMPGDRDRAFQSLNYSLSAGYLLLPIEYQDYRQLNVNLYAELLGQQTLDRKGYFLDAAPALQLIFHSNTKVNIGYRFQVKTNEPRMFRNSWLIGIERTFLNAFH
jgi:hypothetical protein